MTTYHHRQGLIAETRGAVMAEGVIVLPVFVLILAALLYYHHSYAAKLERGVAARSCAWRYSVGGCHQVPEGCPISKISESQIVAIDDVVDGRASTDGASSLGDGLAGASGVVLALLGLREGIVARPSRTVSRPSILGGGERRIAGEYAVMCNERNRDAFELGVDVYCAVVGDEMPGCPRERS